MLVIIISFDKNSLMRDVFLYFLLFFLYFKISQRFDQKYLMQEKRNLVAGVVIIFLLLLLIGIFLAVLTGGGRF